MQAIQILTAEYVQRSAALTPSERLEILEEFRLLLPLSIFEERLRAYRAVWFALTDTREENHSP